MIASENYAADRGALIVGPNTLSDRICFELHAVACLNPECRKVTFEVSLKQRRSQDDCELDLGQTLQRWKLLPESSAKPQPDYIPKAIRDDYIEACRIRELSPRASATLARRCLQGMVRDFCGIRKGMLGAEIRELRWRLDDRLDEYGAPQGVTKESVDAIDHVRTIGNIGAHMERDVNLIVEIDADEAQILIDLIETLFDEWYVARHARQQKFAAIKAMSKVKREQQAQLKGAAAAPKALPVPDKM